MLIYFPASLYIIIFKGAMLCARVRVIVRACDPMRPRARARGIGAARACKGGRAYINARGHASGRGGAQGGGAVGRGRSQRRQDGPGRRLSPAAGAIPPPWPLRGSQGRSAASRSERCPVGGCGPVWAAVARAACRRGPVHEKSPHPSSGGRGRGARGRESQRARVGP